MSDVDDSIGGDKTQAHSRTECYSFVYRSTKAL